MKNELTLVIVHGEGMRAEECTHPLFGDARMEKIARMKPESGKKQLALAELACLAAMKISFGVCEKNAYRYAENGKPVSVHAENRFLSIAHAGEFGACIWSDVPVGMDIENTERDVSRIIHRIGSNKDDQSMPPLSLWCAKESFVKLTGEGLSRPFSTIGVSGGKAFSGKERVHLYGGEACGCTWAVSLSEERSVRVLCLSVQEALSVIDP